MAVVVSHSAPSFERLARQALRQVPLADVVELRLDALGDPGEERLAELISGIEKPVIVACPGPEAHGVFAGSDDERLEILRTAARAGAAFVDVDWRLSLDLGEVEGKCHRIVSRHDVEGTPEDLDALRDEVVEALYEGDLIKLVTHASRCEDGLRMLAFVDRIGGGLIGFCSGEPGSFTRVLAPIFGSPFTYAAAAVIPDEPEPERTAPGQLRVNDLRGLFPPGGATTATAVFAVIGRDVRHSWSPRVHGMALKGARLDAVYLALEPETLAGLLEHCQHENWRGFSVTAPFKEEAFALAGSHDRASESARACNTLVRDPEGWQGRNTDAPAVHETLSGALRVHTQRTGTTLVAESLDVLVLGTGGAARACVVGVQQSGARAVLAGRRDERAREVAEELGCRAIAWAEIPGFDWDVLVHATPLGSAAALEAGLDELPIPVEWIRPGRMVVDAVYRPVRTALLMAAIERDCTAVPGGEWFVRQAAGQFRIFTQTDPDYALMRAAFDHAVGEERGAGPG